MSATIGQTQREQTLHPDSDGQPMAENTLQILRTGRQWRYLS